MMKEIAELHAAVKPIETLFVVDAMLGQDAVNTAKAFNEALPLTGVILTKLDGDARGGAALSVRHVTGKPIKFAGVGEKLTGLEAFHPERMASRILGMGDVLSLIEDARKASTKRRRSSSPRSSSPARASTSTTSRTRWPDAQDGRPVVDDGQAAGAVRAGRRPVAGRRRGEGVARIEGIINSMTPTERVKPELLKASAQAPHRHGCRGSGAGSQSPAQAVRADAEDDEAVLQGRHGEADARHEGDDAGDALMRGQGA
jgi:signal recognition particle subunit SRP54